MPILQNTTNRGYALPYPSNLLADDVLRLREALQAVDVDVEALFDGLALRLTQAQVEALISSAVTGLVNGAPGALNTLEELAAALGDDANFAATVTNALSALETDINSVETSVAAVDARVTALNAWQVVTSNITAAANSRLFVNTSSAARTITLPANPTLGTYVQIVDAASTFNTNNCTVARNGSLVMGLAEDLVLDVKNATITLVYADASTGWRIS